MPTLNFSREIIRQMVVEYRSTKAKLTDLEAAVLAAERAAGNKREKFEEAKAQVRAMKDAIVALHDRDKSDAVATDLDDEGVVVP